MRLFNKYRDLNDDQLKLKIKRAKTWKVCELFCDIIASLLIISTIFVTFNNEFLFHIYILVIMIPVLILIFLPLIIRYDGKAAEKQFKENKFKRIKGTNLKDYIILDDKEICQEIYKQCVESVMIQKIPGSKTREISFYLINEEVVSKPVDTDEELWKTISLK